MTIGEFMEILKKHNPDEHVAIAMWQTDDIIGYLVNERGWEEWEALQLPQEYLDEIIDNVEHRQDASIGISWTEISCAIDNFFDEKRNEE